MFSTVSAARATRRPSSSQSTTQSARMGNSGGKIKFEHAPGNQAATRDMAGVVFPGSRTSINANGVRPFSRSTSSDGVIGWDIIDLQSPWGKRWGIAERAVKNISHAQCRPLLEFPLSGV